MGNKCVRPSLALDDAPAEAITFFKLRFPEKYRCVCELEEAVVILGAVATENQDPSQPMVWSDLDCVSHRSVVHCLENQIMHVKTSVVEHAKTAPKRRRKQVCISTTVEVIERWGDAGAFLFASEEPGTPPACDEDSTAPATASSSQPFSACHLNIEGKPRLSKKMLTCWEGEEEANDLSGASTPVLSSSTALQQVAPVVPDADASEGAVALPAGT
eukprot:CAMPEP_0180157644 /NCGR_PEP_ID=MMETSP0986-20121125/26375_1 /TAXON_ID=697907 /ORGANISM="non described non described, Strain CCMP2293" /LENGTH=215 /DNA_ID=CAMNT_0022107225 /DNA_START=40 /DNA_END=688 /DNA_ORIENTATION=+